MLQVRSKRRSGSPDGHQPRGCPPGHVVSGASVPPGSARSRWCKRAATVTATVAGASVLALGGAPAASADDCANAELRVGASAFLSDCRAYEQVTGDKGRYGYIQTNDNATPAYPSLDGDRFYGGLVTPLADPISGSYAQVVSTRTVNGWESVNITPDFCNPDPSGQGEFIAPVTFARDFSVALMQAPRSDCDPDDHAGDDLYTRPIDRSGFFWQSHNNQPKFADDPAGFSGASGDLSHIVFSTREKLVPTHDAVRQVGSGLYDRTGGRAIPVDVRNDGSPLSACGVSLANPGGDDRLTSPVSVDGQVIVFVQGAYDSLPGCRIVEGGGQLYARVGHRRTVLLSESRRTTPDARVAPRYMGATEDGSRVFFATTERLTDDATTGGGLYEYDLGPVLRGEATKGHTRFLSPSITSAAAAIEPNAGIAFSDDGSRVYFVARGVLAPGADPSGVVLKLYVTEAGAVRLVGTWRHAPSTAIGAVASSSPNGSQFAFVDGTPGEIKLFGLADGSITCVSCPPDAAPATDTGFGRNGRSRPASLGQNRHVTDDGRVYFETAHALASRDTNGKVDVYEYVDGDRRLISSGTNPYDSRFAGISPDARDVFFFTNESLVAEDVDRGDQDVYVARIGGGFPPPADSDQACVGDACRPGAAGPLPLLTAPGSMGFTGGGNLPGSPTRPAESTPRVTAPTRRTIRGTRGTVSVRVNGRGGLRVRGSGVRTAYRTARKSGTYRMAVRLNQRATRTYRRSGRVAVRVTVRYAPFSGSAVTRTVRVPFQRPRAASRSTATSRTHVPANNATEER